MNRFEQMQEWMEARYEREWWLKPPSNGKCIVPACTRKRAAVGVYCDRCRKRLPESPLGHGGGVGPRLPEERRYNRDGVTSMHAEFLRRLGYSACQSRCERTK